MAVRLPTRIFPMNHIDLSWRPHTSAPENEDVCLVMCVSEDEPEIAWVTTGYYDGEWSVEVLIEDEVLDHVVAWMPMPGPPACSCSRGLEN